MAHRLVTSQQRNSCWEKISRTQNCSRLLRWPAINWKQQFWIYNTRIAAANSTTAVQTIFMIRPGSVNVLSMGNTLRYITFFSALKEITACHITARAKNRMTLLCTVRTNLRQNVRTCLHTCVHTYIHTCVTAHTYTHTHVHTHTNTHAHTSYNSHNKCTYKMIRNAVLTQRKVCLEEYKGRWRKEANIKGEKGKRATGVHVKFNCR